MEQTPSSPMGILIEIEGPEFAGKSTMVKKLEAALKSIEGCPNIHIMRFPNREGLHGSLISKSLRGEVKTGANELALLMAANRNHEHDTIMKYLSAGDIIICDRYMHSGIAYWRTSLRTHKQYADTGSISVYDIIPKCVPDVTIYMRHRSEYKRSDYGSEIFDHNIAIIEEEFAKIKGKYSLWFDWEQYCDNINGALNNPLVNSGTATDVDSMANMLFMIYLLKMNPDSNENMQVYKTPVANPLLREDL